MLIDVTFKWDDCYGQCHDCGLPAAYDVTEFGSIHPAAKLCCLCAAQWAATDQSVRLEWLFAEDFEDVDDVIISIDDEDTD